MNPLTIAVITGGHHYDVVAFHQLFRALPGIDAYVQHMADFVISPRDLRASYDVLVFYTHLKDELAIEGGPPDQDDTVRSVLETLGATDQGLVLLHHSLVAFPDWAIWDAVTGLQNRRLMKYKHDEAIPLHIVDADHPVASGLLDWTITDETYLLPDAAGDNHVLITTDHPDSMSTLAWTRQHNASRVVCVQPGDARAAWEDAQYRTLLSQAIEWAAGRQ